MSKDLTKRIKERLNESWQDASHVFTVFYTVKGDPTKNLFQKTAYIDAKKYSKDHAEKQIVDWIKKYPNVVLSPNYRIGYTTSMSEAKFGNQMNGNFAKHQVMAIFWKKGETYISQEYYKVDASSTREAEDKARVIHEKKFPGSKIQTFSWVAASL